MQVVKPEAPNRSGPNTDPDAASVHPDTCKTDQTQSEAQCRLQTAAAAEPAKKKGRVRSVVFECLFYLVLIVIVAFVYTAGTGNASGPRSLFGYTASTVLTGSMQSELPQESLIITKQVDPNTLKVKDNITFLQENGSTVTHKIVGIYENYDQRGMRAFITQGTENGMADDEVVWADNVVGKVIWHNLFLGQAINYVKSNILFVGVMAVLVIGFFVALRVFIASGKKDPEKGDVPKDGPASIS